MRKSTQSRIHPFKHRKNKRPDAAQQDACDELPPCPRPLGHSPPTSRSLHARLGGGFGVDFLERIGRGDSVKSVWVIE